MSAAKLAKSHYRHSQYVRAGETGQIERLQLLLRGLLDMLYQCEGCIESRQIARKGELVGRCMDIFITLKQNLASADSHLDIKPQLGAMTGQLNQLYDHCLFLLSRTTLEDNLEALKAVQGVVKTLIDAWEATPLNTGH
ncbi:flagellar protein FliS [Parendozoicomonas sp. Alg238-R29]|uniref:flagellar export chaperone FliS n=1 Tax=Parendozoicomonas sp. Alg238-R29 TaxID=2993446 RepID=UPI00248E21BD|nr:flagellar protein FliS [Parendozoicomonas sp. Alg238-R29]